MEKAQIAYDEEQAANKGQDADDELARAQEQAQMESEEFHRGLWQKEWDRAEQDKAELEQQLGAIDGELGEARKAIEDGKNIQVNLNSGMGADPGFNYDLNSYGDIRDPGQVARAQRFAKRAKRDADSKNIGENQAKRKKDRMEELQDKKRKGRRMEPWEMNELDALEAWDKQREARKAEKKVPDLLQKQQELQEKIKTAAEGIKTLMDNLGLK